MTGGCSGATSRQENHRNLTYVSGITRWYLDNALVLLRLPRALPLRELRVDDVVPVEHALEVGLRRNLPRRRPRGSARAVSTRTAVVKSTPHHFDECEDTSSTSRLVTAGATDAGSWNRTKKEEQRREKKMAPESSFLHEFSLFSCRLLAGRASRRIERMDERPSPCPRGCRGRLERAVGVEIGSPSGHAFRTQERSSSSLSPEHTRVAPR